MRVGRTSHTGRARRHPVVAVAAAALLAALAVLSGCSDDGAGDETSSPSPSSSTAASPPAGKEQLRAFYRQELDWSSCQGDFQCARLTVPVDYKKPRGRTIKISVVRLPASGRRIGAVVLNPGGPGGSGIEYARAATRVVTSSVRERFDVVGFDPRGVGESAPIRCISADQLDRYVGLDPTPDTGAERSELINMSRAFVRGCQQRSPSLLPYVSTVDAAKDMDILRAALGDDKLTYVGKSYGTFLGAWYAQQFPSRVRALILDGAVDPALSGRELNRAQARGFETALDAFLTDCVDRGGCPLGGSFADAERRLEQLIADVDEQPLPARNAPGDDGRVVNEAWAVLGIAAALYSQNSGWPALRYGLDQALGGDGSVLLQLADSLVDRRTDGTYSNQSESNLAVNCIDRPEPRSVAPYEQDARDFAQESPHFGALIGWGTLPCAFWPVPAVVKPSALQAAGAAPILVIGTTRDPATPYRWSQNLADELDSGVLLTYRGDGHTVWGTGASGCVDRIGNDYLIDLKVPKRDTTC